jgi:hypothetical protein
MEDIFGVVIFIVFIVIRTLSDRKKGKNKKATPQKPKATPAERPASDRKQKAAAKPGSSAPVTRRQTATTQTSRTIHSTQTTVFPQTAPEVRRPPYASLPYPEGIVPPAASVIIQPEETREGDIQPEVVQRRYGLNAQVLRQAIIWNEIIEKPRFKRRQVR